MVEQFKFSINIRPRATDEYRGTGMVYMSTYLDWTEDVVNAYVEKLGLVTPPNRALVPLRQEITYHSPLMIREEAKVSNRITRLGRSSTVGDTQITEARSGRLIVTIMAVGVWMDIKTGRSVPIPDEWKQKVIAFEGKANVEVAEG